MGYRNNKWKSGICEKCSSKTGVIRFKNTSICSRCLTVYEKKLAIEDFVYSGSSCMDLGPGALFKKFEVRNGPKTRKRKGRECTQGIV